ncbi:MAG: hypothetical protein CMP10_14470 [Zetaproteobacteria bacterium]|nr:hypothetical protein [Pseudobdellovibrionaceae bacterium]
MDLKSKNSFNSNRLYFFLICSFLLHTSIALGSDSWKVLLPDSGPDAIVVTANDLADYLKKMNLESKSEKYDFKKVPTCAPGQNQIVFIPGPEQSAEAKSILADELPENYNEQSWSHRTVKCGEGNMVLLAGGGLLGRQYAAYRWLHDVGVRFFHPEQEFVPTNLTLKQNRHLFHTPDFKYRGVTLHLTHPLELGDVFVKENPEYEAEAKRYINWLIKNGASYSNSKGSSVIRAYSQSRGFPLTEFLNLYGSQQDDVAIINPDAEMSEEEQIVKAIDERLAGELENSPEFIGVDVSPTEFDQIEDTKAVYLLNFVTQYVNKNYPGVTVTTVNHGTASKPTKNYGVPYSNLAGEADPNLTVWVHTLMFYDLERPAPVYGNKNFNWLYDFMVDQQDKRKLWHFPEAAWWLTFDIAIPLYLPITVEARDRDIQKIKPMLKKGLEGHLTFGSGHEWGYWQNEYCSLYLAMDVSLRWYDCFKQITGIMGLAADEVQKVIEDSVDLQSKHMFDSEILRYLVGTDPETMLAKNFVASFHPLPPTPKEINSWNQAEIDDFRQKTALRLQSIADEYATLVGRLNKVEAKVPGPAKSWFDEIRDGLKMFEIRANHQVHAYSALVSLREAKLKGENALKELAKEQSELAKKITVRAKEVVTEREKYYRYFPLSRSIGGGEEGNNDSNWTSYPYRYLNRTHNVYYYTYIDSLVDQAINQELQFDAKDYIVVGGKDFVLYKAASVSDQVYVDDDASESDTPIKFSGEEYIANDSVIGLRNLRLLDDQNNLLDQIDFARVTSKYTTGHSAKVTQPASGSIIASLLPGLVVGSIANDKVVVGFDISGKSIAGANLIEIPLAQDISQGLKTNPTDIKFPLILQDSGQIIASMTIFDAVVSLEEDEVLKASGAASVSSIVDAVIELSAGAFSRENAIGLVAGTFGLDAENLPERVDMELTYDVKLEGEKITQPPSDDRQQPTIDAETDTDPVALSKVMGTFVQVEDKKLKNATLSYSVDPVAGIITTDFKGKAKLGLISIPVDNSRVIKVETSQTLTSFLKTIPSGNEITIGYDGQNDNSRHYASRGPIDKDANTVSFSIENNARTFKVTFLVDLSQSILTFVEARIEFNAAIASLDVKFVKPE